VKLYNIDINLKNVIIKKKIGGKPFLPDYPNIYFNMSHSGKYSVCAFSQNECGVDIQEIYPVNIRIAKRVFHQNECIRLEKTDINEQTNAFYELRLTLSRKQIICVQI
jgi:4'-phosphopantetheinyl transferase